MDLRDLAAIVTGAVAIYGAGLSTYTALVSRRAAQRRLRAELTLGVIGDQPEPRTVFLLSAVNPGQRVVTITMAVIRLPDGRQFVPLDPPLAQFLPRELREGQRFSIPVPIAHVVTALAEAGYRDRVRLRADFRDVLDINHMSRPLRGNVSKWAELADRQNQQAV